MLGLLGACSASLDSAQAPEATTPKAAAFMGGGATAPVAVTETTKPTEKSATGAAAAIARAGKTEIPSALATPKVDVGSPSYKINALDVLEVVVFKVPDLNRTVTVAAYSLSVQPQAIDLRRGVVALGMRGLRDSGFQGSRAEPWQDASPLEFSRLFHGTVPR